MFRNEIYFKKGVNRIMAYGTEILKELGFGNSRNYKEKVVRDLLKEEWGIEHMRATNTSKNINEYLNRTKLNSTFSTGLVQLKETRDAEEIAEGLFDILENNGIAQQHTKNENKQLLKEILSYYGP